MKVEVEKNLLAQNERIAQEKKKILEGTKLGEDMFIADFLLKQITMG